MPDEEMGEAMFRQVFELWINPEVTRRQQDGRISEPFTLRAAQIVIEPDGSVPVVRLNDEVQVIITARFNRAIEAGDSVSESDIAEISELRVTEQDGNAGHITLLRLKDKWFIAFDFRYNRRRIKTTLATAEEFFVTAKAALEDRRLRAAIDTIFSATELCAKAMLLSLPDKRLLTSKKHGFIAAEFNKRASGSDEIASFARLLKRLSELRPKARYAEGDQRFSVEEVAELLTVAETLYQRAQQEAVR